MLIVPRLTWQFPPNVAGETEGPNDSGISHFTDRRDENLIRESVQNSLDARAGDAPAKIEFSLDTIHGMDFEADQLSEILSTSIQSPDNDEEHRAQFTKGKNLLRRNQRIPVLCVKDSNTTGAADMPRDGGAPSKWKALTKGSGSVVKEQKDSAGSFGLGKHSAFAVTDLRTVLYSTTWHEDDGLKRSRFIGKSILVSHTDRSGVARRSTGYLSLENYAPLVDKDVPPTFRLGIPGTAIYIVGYDIGPRQGSSEWKRNNIATAIENYFHAIIHGNLIVSINDEEVNVDNVEKEYDKTYLERKTPSTVNFIRVSRMMPMAQDHFPGVGNVSLRILIHEDHPGTKVREIALVRDSGMMITDRPSNMSLRLERIPSHWRGFTAVIECKSEPGISSYVRDSESPKHDKLSVDYIDDPDRRKQARNTLQEIGRWVRAQIEAAAGLRVPESDDYMDELSKYLGIYDEDGKVNDPDKPATVFVTPPRQSRNPGGGAGPFGGEHGGRRRRRRKVAVPGPGGDEPGGRGGGDGNTGDGRRPPRQRVSGI